MKKLISLLSLIIFALAANTIYADPIIDKIEAAGKNRAKITGQFTQTKTSSAGKVTETKKGTLTFTLADNKLEMKYTSPKGDYFCTGGDKMTMTKSGKTLEFNLTKNALMRSLSNLLTNSFAGRIKQIEKDNDVSVATSSNSDSYTITFTSKKKVVKGYSSIVLTYDKTKLQLKKMKLEEWTGQVTTYELN